MVRKILFTGLGSVGQRHARNLRAMYGDNIELYAYRSRKLQQVINSDMTVDKGSPTEKYSIIEYNNLEKALSIDLDAVFITNPPDLHIETAKLAINSGAHVFIEKPLSHNLDGIDELIEIVENKKLICMVGHQLRYHIITEKIKEILSQNLLGKLISAELIFAEYLPDMHPYEDYRISHAASESRGGGSILSLNHDIDIACHLFGLPSRIFCMGGKYSNLEMDTEDMAMILMELQKETGPMSVYIHLDFLKRPTRREWIITGELGSLYGDLVQNFLAYTSYVSKMNGRLTKYDFSDFMRDEMFKSEVADFFNSIENGRKSPLDLREAKSILEVAIAAKKSLKSGLPVNC